VQGNTLTHKNLLGECIAFSHWERVSDTLSKVQRTPFTYSSLFTDDRHESSGVQLSLFETMDPLYIFSLIETGKEDAPQPRRYVVVDIEQVWKEEKENV
jgi:hypothetical protein